MKINFRKMKWMIILLLFSITDNTFAQTDAGKLRCEGVKQKRGGGTLARPTVADVKEDDYDMKYVHLDLTVNNQDTKIKGLATTKATVVAASMGEYVFELLDELTIDSLKFNGSILPVTGSGYVRAVTLPTPLMQGDAFTVQVYYHGEPTFGPNFFTTGIRNETSPDWGAQVTYTMSESYASRDWWPTKQSLQDKIDSSDVWLTIAAGLKGGSNGVLESITPLTGGKSRYQWKNRSPIDYYLISFAVSTYTDYSYYMHFDNSNDSMLVQNYVYDNPGTLPLWKSNIDSTALMINYFSGLFGRYPFWKEKYGHCMSPLGGGMEHQTMTTLNNFESSLVAHELGHQWFGDHVTCGTWGDIWLNEGFATYLDYLFRNYAWGAPAGKEKMDGIHEDVMQEDGGSVYCTDTTDEGRIFNGRLTYNKGAAIVHTLRFVAGNDSLFYNTLKHYQVQFANGHATTDQFRDFVALQYNRNMDTFFNQWIYGEGYPTFAARWNQDGNTIVVQLNQTTSMPSSVPFFNTPLEIKLTSAQGDTTVTVNTSVASGIYTFLWHKVMTGMEIDPNNWIVNKTGGIIRDHGLTIDGFDTSLFAVYPNPSNSNWHIDGMPMQCKLSLSDISGRVVWQGDNGNSHSMVISSGLLAKGMYLLRIAKNGSKSTTLKLMKME